MSRTDPSQRPANPKGMFIAPMRPPSASDRTRIAMAAIISCRAEFTALSERDRTLLRSLLAATQARTGVRWDGGASQPLIHFVDVDNPAGADFFRALSDSERREAAIVLSSAAQPAAVRWLSKPLRSATLLDVLAQMPLAKRAAASLAPPSAPVANASAVP